MTSISMMFGAPNVVRYTRGREWLQNITNMRRLHPTVALL